MTDRSRNSATGGFGKRGVVQIERPQKPLPGTELDPIEPRNQGFALPKWAIGLVAAAFFFALIGGTGGSGGILGGLLGGLLGAKLFSKTNTVAGTPRAPLAGTQGHVQPASNSVQRGGFGSTGSSRGFFSFGG